MKKKKLKVAIVSAVCALFVLLASLTVYAFFTTRVYVYTNEGNKEAFHTGMQLQLLFDKLLPSMNGEEVELPNYTLEGGVLVYNEKVTIDTSAKWGSAKNPYVISTIRHLQNLSALQSLGYFDLMYLNENFENGDYIEGEAEMPYFVICNTDGTPTVITDPNGATITIKPIGSAEHPFVGVIGGAFVDGTATIGSGENAKTTTVSAIHNIKVQTTTNQTDVGLFGYVGFLGEEPKQADITAGTAEPQFMGATSSIKNLLISDVQIVVKEPNIAELISDLFGPLWEKYFDEGYHRYTYTNKEVKAGETHPEETHHIGILAGHVSYASVDKISVYYSKEDIKALDLKGANLTTDNYYSVSGILGMFYNMNCKVASIGEEGVTSHCVIKMGTGTTSDEVSNAVGSGSGTGGGIYSGNGRGYVTAAEIFTTFNNVDVLGESNNELLWRYKLSANGEWAEGAILILKKMNGQYTLADGETAVTEISEDGVKAGQNTWEKYFVRETYAANGGELQFRYIDPNGEEVYECELMGNKYHGQTIWKYNAGGNAIWHYGIHVYQTGSGTSATYTLEDKKTTVTLNADNFMTDGTYVWESFFVTKADGSSYMIDPSTGNEWVVSKFERKPMTLIESYRLTGTAGAETIEKLCIQWVSNDIVQDEPAYYFYDGVFTFGLSSEDDTVRDTWQNDETPTLYLGERDKYSWKAEPQYTSRAVVALLSSVRSNSELDKAIAEGKQLYITARPQGSSTDAYLMSLITQSADGGKVAGAINGQALQIDNTLRNALAQYYRDGIYNQLPTVPNTLTGTQQMIIPIRDGNNNLQYDPNGSLLTRPVELSDMSDANFWGNYTVLNIGQTSDTLDLATLKKLYNVVAKNVVDNNNNKTYYYYRADTGAAVTTTTNRNGVGTVPNLNYWNGYIYYTCDYVVTKQEQGKSGTFYDTERVYTFEFYYQPPDGAEPVPIDVTTMTIEGYLDPNLGQEYNVWRIRAFQYSDVVYPDGVTAAMDGGSQVIQNSELMFDYTYVENGETKTVRVPMVNISAGRFHGAVRNGGYGQTQQPNYNVEETRTTAAIISGSYVSKNASGTKNYYFLNVTDGKYYRNYNRNDVEVNKAEYENNSDYVLLIAYPAYTFSDTSSSTPSYLQFLHQYRGENYADGKYGSMYSLWAGTDNQYNSLQLGRGNSKNGVLVFEEGEEYCYIRYTMDSRTQYLSYTYDETTKTAEFVGSETKEKLYVYIIEGVVDMGAGVNKFVPDESTESLEFSAGDVVFWPQTTLKTDGTYKENGSVKDEDETGKASDVKTKNPTYSIIHLTGENGLNWGDSSGYILGADGKHGLDKKFQMADQAVFGNVFTDGDSLTSFVDPNAMIAPVGSNGVNAVIPKGCVAFRVNSEKSQTVRIIVAVPTTSYYLGAALFDLDLEMDYYIGLWKLAAVGESDTISFKKSAALEKFELPRSYPYSLEDTPDKVEDNQTYVNVEYEGEEYRTYLNGDTFLVAYEFTVSGEGVYVIGSVHGSDTSSGTKDSPMEIVHFSVSGTASAGRDGVQGNQLGTIDFVYDDLGGKIITVGTTITSENPLLPNEKGNEDYANYYASQSLLFTDYEQKSSGSYILINQAQVYVRRWLSRSGNEGSYTYKTMITYYVESDDANQKAAIVIKNYTDIGDKVELLTQKPTS